MKLLAMVLLAAVVLKGRQLLTEPVVSSSIWSSRPFLIFQVEFELALGLWFLSGLFKKAAWLAAVLCFSVFSVVTLYKGLTGAASCGCFGQVHVNPWLTLFAIDLPAVIALTMFRTGVSLPLPPFSRDLVRKNSSCLLGRLTEEKEWFITTPAVVLLTDSIVESAWEAQAPDIQTIIERWLQLP